MLTLAALAIEGRVIFEKPTSLIKQATVSKYIPVYRIITSSIPLVFICSMINHKLSYFSWNKDTYFS